MPTSKCSGMMELEARHCAIITAVNSGRNEKFVGGKEYLCGPNISSHI